MCFFFGLFFGGGGDLRNLRLHTRASETRHRGTGEDVEDLAALYLKSIACDAKIGKSQRKCETSQGRCCT